MPQSSVHYDRKKYRWGVRHLVLQAFLFLLTAHQALVADPAWQWGVELPEGCPDGNQSYVAPNGKLGCHWFNYLANWTQDVYVKFENWSQPKWYDHCYCFEGTLASIMNYYRWPDRTQQKGPFHGVLTEIDHVWNYSQINSGNCLTDDVFTRQLTGCQTGYCMVVDEIRRLSVAARIAAYWDGYVSFTYTMQRFQHILRNRLGYVNAEFLEGSAPDALDKIKYELVTKDRPIINMWPQYGHAWVDDAYQSNNGRDELHHLDGLGASCFTNRHPANWNGLNILEHYFINLDPTVTVLKSGPALVKKFVFGDDQIYKTSGARFQERFRIVAAPTNTATGNLSATLNVNLYNHGTSQWVLSQTLLTGITIPVSTAGTVTPYFTFSVPVNDSAQLELSLTGTGASANADIRMVLEDSPISKMTLSLGGVQKMEIHEDGMGVITGNFAPATWNGALEFKNGGSSTVDMGLNDHGDLKASSVINNNPNGELDDPSFLSQGVGFFYLGKANIVAKHDIPVYVRGTLYPTNPIQLGAFESIFFAGQCIPIPWSISNGYQINNVAIKYIDLADNAKHTIESPIPAADLQYSWCFPSELVGSKIKILIENTADVSVFAMSTEDISISDKQQAIIAPDAQSYLKVGQPVTIKWKFDPTCPSYMVWISYDSGKSFSGPDGATTESFVWTPTQVPQGTDCAVIEISNYDRNRVAFSQCLQIH
jgi:hypothetical protein